MNIIASEPIQLFRDKSILSENRIEYKGIGMKYPSCVLQFIHSIYYFCIKKIERYSYKNNG